MGRADESVSLGDVEVIAVTDRALLVRGDFGGDEDGEWIPKSQIAKDGGDLDENALVGEEGELAVTSWLAGKRGW